MVEIEINKNIDIERLRKNAVISEVPKDKIELPKELTPRNVQYYCHETKLLEQSQRHKAKLFVEHKCIEYDSENKCYYCKPLPGYNTRTYTLQYNKELGTYECNCQGFQKMVRLGELRPTCSHILALHYHWKIKEWNKNT